MTGTPSQDALVSQYAADLSSAANLLYQSARAVLSDIEYETKNPKWVHSFWTRQDDKLRVETSLTLFQGDLEKLVRMHDQVAVALASAKDPEGMNAIAASTGEMKQIGMGFQTAVIDYLDARLWMLKTGAPSQDFLDAVEYMKRKMEVVRGHVNDLARKTGSAGGPGLLGFVRKLLGRG